MFFCMLGIVVYFCSEKKKRTSQVDASKCWICEFLIIKLTARYPLLGRYIPQYPFTVGKVCNMDSLARNFQKHQILHSPPCHLHEHLSYKCAFSCLTVFFLSYFFIRFMTFKQYTLTFMLVIPYDH